MGSRMGHHTPSEVLGSKCYLPMLRINLGADSYPAVLPSWGSLPWSLRPHATLRSLEGRSPGLQWDTIIFRARPPLLPSPAEPSLASSSHPAPHLTSRPELGGQSSPHFHPTPKLRTGIAGAESPRTLPGPSPTGGGRVFWVAQGSNKTGMWGGGVLVPVAPAWAAWLCYCGLSHS